MSGGIQAGLNETPAAKPRAAGEGARPRFHHELLFYGEGDAGFVEAIAPAVRDALAREAPVLVAVAPPRASALREALGADAERVRTLDMHAIGRNPARIIPAWDEFLDAAPGGAHALGVGEPVWPGRSRVELEECARHEALLNVAFDAGRGWDLLCPYDLDGLDEQVLEGALHTHPHVRLRERVAESHSYAPPSHQPSAFAGALPRPAGDARELHFTAGELCPLRQALGAWARGESMSATRTQELVLAINELATNSVSYGGGSGALCYWREGRTLVCEVRDAGTLEEPLLGCVRPARTAYSGRGLWIVNQLCDLVQIRSRPGESVVRVQMEIG